MLRKVAVLIVSAGLALSPLSVQALGFGGIKLKSSLNEKLVAEVSLLSATDNDVQSLTINLATEEAFLRSGIDRTALLNKLKFKVKQHSNGDYYIAVSTTETVREPFMNFLLELNWKNGRMLREYTMLIDPPGNRSRQASEPAPVMAETQPEAVEETVMEEPVVKAEPATRFAEPFAEPEEVVVMDPEEEIAGAPTFEEEPTEEVEMVEASDGEAPPDIEVAMPEEVNSDAVFEEESASDVWPRIPLAAYREDAGAVSEEVELTSSGEMGDLDYGIVKKNDMLWNIAEKLRQGDESVSVHQVMMALLQSNPDAFVDNNVHRLKVGHVLRINDAATLTSLSRKQAANAFVEQTNAWNDYRQQVAEAAGIQPIMAAEDVTANDSRATNAAGELTLSSPEGETLTTGGGANEESISNDLATMQEQLRQAKSDSGTMRTRNVALNDKLQSLEDELNRLQRSITVKDDELAALQQQLSSLNQNPVVEPEPAQEQPMVAETPVATEEPVQEEVPEPAKVEEPVKAVEIATPEMTNPESDIMDTVMGVVASVSATVVGLAAGGDSMLYIGIPAGLLVLIFIIMLIKRRSSSDNFEESILTGAATGSADDTNGLTSGDSTTFSEESSFLSDFAMSGASAIEADDSEVDPLTEADVFMAYGRYEAAEERLNEAVQNEPGRMELRAKLLELYHATQNKPAFESAAEDFYASLGGADNPLWDKVVSMGTEIAPENPLFSQGGGVSDILSTSEVPAIDDLGMEMTDSQVMDIGLETGVFAAADLGTTGDSGSDGMDFNLDLGDSLASDDSPADSSMDFNLDIGGGDAPAIEEPAADLDFNLDMGSTDDSAGLDFNLDIGGDAPAAEEPAADLDFNLDMGSTEDASGLEFDLDIGGDDSSDLGLDFDSGSDSGLDLNLDASDTADADIGGGDEVGTKLDLAKAYIDMGDPEGARSILDEVMDEGSSTQKEEAQSLLGQIA